ncbi:Reverse transcriptase family protein [Trichuris trichiura]|uniref:Reverse transcriptase family protein n=1 Tax=Trichuris trichiura TaxID=36087 RepID=A0A077ZCT3_TRITR|nr:Reverse transcriptase family protein [Trichuris trichiura]
MGLPKEAPGPLHKLLALNPPRLSRASVKNCWSTPIVPVSKSNGTIRLCSDKEVPINIALRNHSCPTLAVNNLLSNLSGGQVFAKIGMTQAYLQLPVDNALAEVQMVIPRREAFKIKRLQFEQIMNGAFNSVSGVTPYFKGILIKAAIFQELECRLKQSPEDQSIWYSPISSKARSNLQGTSTSGSIGIRSFVRDKAATAEQFHRCLDKMAKWKWAKGHEESYQTLKKLHSSDSVLTPFNNSLSITLTCDPSPCGMRAVLNQRKSNGKEAAVAFQSLYKSRSESSHAEALSRPSQYSLSVEVPGVPEAFFLEELAAPPLIAIGICRMTLCDPLLHGKGGWLNLTKPFDQANKKNELLVHENSFGETKLPFHDKGISKS